MVGAPPLYNIPGLVGSLILVLERCALTSKQDAGN
jgi:hypothetical protein